MAPVEPGALPEQVSGIMAQHNRDQRCFWHAVTLPTCFLYDPSRQAEILPYRNTADKRRQAA